MNPDKDILVKGPDGSVIGHVVEYTYNEVDGLVASVEITDETMLNHIQQGILNQLNLDEQEEPKIVHLGKTMKQSVAVCSGEPYSPPKGKGPVKLCEDCYNMTFKAQEDPDVEEYL